MVIWRLKKGLDRRFRSGHPWVYSNELQSSPKGLPAGAPVELQDPGGSFLARGYGNPSSLIAFRSLSRDAAEAEPLSLEGIRRRLAAARTLRHKLGWSETSYRLCFAEADGLPGLIIDRFLHAKGGEILSIQAQTAGMDVALPQILKALSELYPEAGLVVRKDAGYRKLEGLQEGGVEIFRPLQGRDPSQFDLRTGGIELRADLIGGQKTGFFLDQSFNVNLAAALFSGFASTSRELRILDLCSYVGQWGATLTARLKPNSKQVHVTAVDASSKALSYARLNIERLGGRCETLELDVLKDLGNLDAASYDLVISDPPALVQGRKDLPKGAAAYLKLHTEALRLVRPGGGVVCCSCSGLLPEDDFMGTLAKAARRNNTRVAWLARGGQAPDHPVLAEFPEGQYLKCRIGVTEDSKN